MVSRARWVRRSPQKVPVQVTGLVASSTDPKTWTTYVKASASLVGAGLGFVLNGDGIVCIDLDHCVTAGVLSEAAEQLLHRLPGTYVEWSPSGTGLHIWGRGSVIRGRRLRRQGLDVEVYGTGRYITVTGKPLPSAVSKLADVSAVLDELI